MLASSTATESCTIPIPDTIVFKYSKPIAWFKWDSTMGNVRRRGVECLTPREIHASLCGPRPGGVRRISARTVVAYHMNAETSDIEYFTTETLREFLARPVHSTGILQRFIDSGEERNTMLRMHWTPYICSIETYGSPAMAKHGGQLTPICLHTAPLSIAPRPGVCPSTPTRSPCTLNGSGPLRPRPPFPRLPRHLPSLPRRSHGSACAGAPTRTR